MPQTTSANRLDLLSVERFLRVRDWKFQRDVAGDRHWQRGDFRIVICPDIDSISIYHLVADAGQINDVSTLEALEATLVSIGAMEWECPNCGETGGEPRERFEEFVYGADADGNRGERRTETQEGCSHCIRG